MIRTQGERGHKELSVIVDIIDLDVNLNVL